MERIKEELIYLSQINLILDNNVIKKLKMTIKYYFLRASSSVRNSEIIQMNHFIDDLRLSEASDSVSVVFSPSTVAVPLAAALNRALIRNEVSKLFYIDQNGQIHSHALEYVIPVMVAVFSGDLFMNEFKSCGSLFIASLFLSTEIIERLLSQELSTYKIACATIALIVSTLMAIKKESVVYILDKLFKDDEEFSIREWLELIYAQRYPPYGHVYKYKPSTRSQAVLAIFEHSLLNRSAPIQSQPINNILFCLPSFYPLTSVICASIPCEVFETSFERLNISINHNLTKDTGAILSSNLPLSMDEIRHHLKWCLSSFLVWGRDSKQEFSWILFDLDNNEAKAVFDRISIGVVEEDTFLVKINIEHTDVSLSRHILDYDALVTSFKKWDHALQEHIVCALSSTVGVDGCRILLENIDELRYQPKLTEALAFVFERPPLD